MPDILFSFVINADPARVFDTVATPTGLNAWWPIDSSGRPGLGERYEFDFGPGYRWAAVVKRCAPGVELEWEMTEADSDWTGTRVHFALAREAPGTRVEFAHTGWREPNRHFRVSAYCWAAYLRLLGRHIEFGDVVPYAERSRS
jgi:uncharacterized protein YndB with AHSA1/START domain